MKKTFSVIAFLLAALLTSGCAYGPRPDAQVEIQPEILTEATLIPAEASAEEPETLSPTETPATPIPERISADEAKARIDSGDPVIILDVRTHEEYESAHIPGALLLPNEEIEDTPPALLPDKDAELLIYCRSGNRSNQAAHKLAAMGYTRVYDFGGIINWPYETVTGPNPEGDPVIDGILSDLSAKDLNGALVTKDFFAGAKLTMVYVWTTTCDDCTQEMQDLAALNRDLAGQGFQVIGVAADTTDAEGNVIDSVKKEARDIISQTGADYPHLIPNATLTEVLEEAQTVPTVLFVDKYGMRVGKIWTEAMRYDSWMEVILTLMGEME